MWQQLIPILKNHQRFVITAHVNPDCDALGSELALAEHLQRLGKQAFILNSDAAPAAFRFLDPKQRLKRYSPKRHQQLIEQAEVVVVLDASGGWSRLGQVGEALAKASAVKICIDHHPDATNFVDVALVDTHAAATGELIFGLIQAMNGPITSTIAQALYAAILTDTGSFRFPKTSAKTHQITAQLLKAGVDPLHIYRQIYEQNSLGLTRLRGHVLNSIQTTFEGQVAYYQLAKNTLKSYGVKASALDGFASLGQMIGGVRVTIFCTEASRKRVKISLRSDGTLPVNKLAQAYGGGGHASAAGAIVDGDLDKIMEQLLAQVKQLL